MGSMPLAERISAAAARLSDDALVCELRCAERCALETTRTLRECALLRARCLRLEMQRRALEEASAVQASGGESRR